MSPQAFPLNWPSHRQRTNPAARQAGAFHKMADNGRYTAKADLTLADAAGRLDRALSLFGARYMLLSTNVETRLDGRPRSGQANPADPGAAVYFTLKGEQMVLACDAYAKVEQNIAAIAAHVEALRAIERYGVQTGTEILRAFTALPSPDHQTTDHALFSACTTADEVSTVYRAVAKARAGSDDRLRSLNVARDAAMKRVAI